MPGTPNSDFLSAVTLHTGKLKIIGDYQTYVLLSGRSACFHCKADGSKSLSNKYEELWKIAVNFAAISCDWGIYGLMIFGVKITTCKRSMPHYIMGEGFRKMAQKM